MPYSRAVFSIIAGVSLTAGALAGCSFLEPEKAGLGQDEDLVVTTSQAPEYQAEDTEDKIVKDDLAEPVTDSGLGVTWWNQGVYPDNIRGSVVTIKVRNDNEVPLPPSAIEAPTLEVANGNGGWTDIDLLPYDADVNTNVMPPGLDRPLGVGASTNLQYRFDAAPGATWNVKLHIGNVVWEGNLNL